MVLEGQRCSNHSKKPISLYKYIKRYGCYIGPVISRRDWHKFNTVVLKQKKYRIFNRSDVADVYICDHCKTVLQENIGKGKYGLDLFIPMNALYKRIFCYDKPMESPLHRFSWIEHIINERQKEQEAKNSKLNCQCEHQPKDKLLELALVVCNIVK